MTASPTNRKRKPPGKPAARSAPVLDRKAAFVAAYMGEAKFNAKAAAIMAGHSEPHAASAGSKLLDDPDVIAQIDTIKRERARRCEVTAAELTEIAMGIARGETLATVGVSDGVPVLGEPKHSDRVRAAEFAAKLNGLTVERNETTVTMQPATAEQLRRAAEIAEQRERLEREAAERRER